MNKLGGGGGGGVLIIFLGGGVPPGPENPNPISDQNIRFSIPYFRPDSKCTLFQTLWCVANSARFTAYGPSWHPKRRSCFSSLRSMSMEAHPISDQNGKIYTPFQTRNARKWYPLGRHIPIWLIYGMWLVKGTGWVIVQTWIALSRVPSEAWPLANSSS